MFHASFLYKIIVLSCFYPLIFYFEKFSAWIWPLPFAVNTTLNLSIIGKLGRCSICHISCLAPSYGMGSRLLFLYNELSLLWFFTSCEGFPLGFFAFHPSQKPAFPHFKSVRGGWSKDFFGFEILLYLKRCLQALFSVSEKQENL